MQMHDLRFVRRFLFFLSALVIVVLDQATKTWCIHHLNEDFSVPWVDHILYLTLTYNPSGAFSLVRMPNWLFIAVIAFLLGLVSYYAVWHCPGAHFQLLLGLLAGGGLGNLLDRFRFGYVVDFLDLRWWPVFNVADSAISISLTLLILHFLFHPSKPSSSS